MREKLTEWFKSDADNIVFIYGETDTWTVAQAETGDNKKLQKFILAGKHHGNARIKEASDVTQKEIMDAIKKMLE